MIIEEKIQFRKHFRAIIYYNFQRQLSQQECLAELLSSTISRWHGEFKRGRVSLSDDPWEGAPKTAVTQENVDAVRKLIIEDRDVTYRGNEASLKISKTSIQKILHEELGVRKLVSRWIPHLLTEEQKAARVNWCQKTRDHFNSGNSKNSADWVFQGEEKPTKVIRSRSVSKKMVATFVSKAGHIATLPLNEQRTPKIITELRKINPERRIILHQDNASSHTAQKTRQYLTEENVELLDHPPYSPDLSPNNFFTFPKITNRLREEAVDAFKNAVLDLPANEWNKCFENWFERMQICIKHFRAIIYYNIQRQLSQQECLAELLSSTISRWYGEFKRGRVSVSDDSGWMHQNRQSSLMDRHVTDREIEVSLKISIQKIVHEELGVRKLVSRWIPHLTEENVELLDHPPYSPNDLFTFPKIKNRLRGQKFQSPEEAVDAFKNAVLDLPANKWNKCFKNWFERMQMCINLRGEYFEKQ
ncbi:unnamed protein product [Acanthoscelides obtectus]|uniref:Tc1-like transposase DDE domain-containing protein n=1 Tax=Acanthoscelides obtectus TaxID=200917 RepID=A0A9P0K5N8_ACAOB|nr:unnamed protein product [Acanthoscelides obtectus]CAK1666483.1 Histone-lysine N-methyltransferase SETMAR [Acanthoscelides obtectus]